jgi:hypothetical protein
MIIVGKKSFMVKKVYDLDKKTKSKLDEDIKPVVPETVVGATRINCLSVIVETLKNIQAHNADGELFVIHTLDQFISWVDTAKYWIRDGKKLDGTEVNAVELDLWKEFFTVYKEVCEDVIFKDSAKLRLPRNPRFAITDDQRSFAKEIDAIWQVVNTKAPVEFAEDEQEMVY